MRGNVLVVLATVTLFVAGLFVGVWTQRSRPVPPPPVGPMGEFVRLIILALRQRLRHAARHGSSAGLVRAVIGR